MYKDRTRHSASAAFHERPETELKVIRKGSGEKSIKFLIHEKRCDMMVYAHNKPGYDSESLKNAIKKITEEYAHEEISRQLVGHAIGSLSLLVRSILDCHHS
jgi:hypothetical protein